MSDDVVRPRVHVLLSDADTARIKQPLTDHVVSTAAQGTVCLAVGTELAQRQCARRRRSPVDFLSDDVEAAVVVIRRTDVVSGWLPCLARYRLTKDVVTETLQTQSKHRRSLLLNSPRCFVYTEQ